MTTWKNIKVKIIGRWATMFQTGMDVSRLIIWQWMVIRTETCKVKEFTGEWWRKAKIRAPAWYGSVSEKCYDWRKDFHLLKSDNIPEKSLSKQNTFCLDLFRAQKQTIDIENAGLRSWQEQLLGIIKEDQMEDQNIIWIIGREGKEGKSHSYYK